ncbi:hypothetical protein C9413_21120 [Rhizobium sp. SEMIA 4085]|uniref:hypothetical protein n=1 Tax=Rhizobium TaxID=379 RepID=UPI0014170EB7|nr:MULTISPECIES: hypothetical protein [Rhizobium]NNH31884.1 hypothetical protein [Rhizobium sp. SEMIA 4085]
MAADFIMQRVTGNPIAGLEVAPHFARLMGFPKPAHQLATSILIGATVLICAARPHLSH